MTPGGAQPRIVVGVDGSDNSRQALEWALAEARLRGAHVVAVHAWLEPASVAIGSVVSSAGAELDVFEDVAGRTMSDLLASVDATGLADPIESHVVGSTPAKAVLDAAVGADLVVVGSRGRGGFTGLLLGSVSQQVAHHAPCPVVIVPRPH